MDDLSAAAPEPGWPPLGQLVAADRQQTGKQFLASALGAGAHLSLEETYAASQSKDEDGQGQSAGAPGPVDATGGSALLTYRSTRFVCLNDGLAGRTSSRRAGPARFGLVSEVRVRVGGQPAHAARSPSSTLRPSASFSPSNVNNPSAAATSHSELLRMMDDQEQAPPTERELLSTVWVFPEFLQVRSRAPAGGILELVLPTCEVLISLGSAYPARFRLSVRCTRAMCTPFQRPQTHPLALAISSCSSSLPDTCSSLPLRPPGFLSRRLEYFSHSPFFDRQSTNQQLKMQTIHTGQPVLDEAEELKCGPKHARSRRLRQA